MQSLHEYYEGNRKACVKTAGDVFFIEGWVDDELQGERIIKDQSELYAESAAENWGLGIWDLEDDEQRRI